MHYRILPAMLRLLLCALVAAAPEAPPPLEFRARVGVEGAWEDPTVDVVRRESACFELARLLGAPPSPQEEKR